MRRAAVALVFAAAAAFSSWNPLAAPFGLVVGLAAAVLGARALASAGAGHRRARLVAGGALGLAVLAALGSALVLALTAGVGRGPAGDDIVKAPPPEEVRRTLDEAEAATREARERARGELEQLPSGGGDAARERRE